MSVTTTHTYTVRRPANPYLVCVQCGVKVHAWPDRPGPLVNLPCGHFGYRNLCPSWGPVDGCRCDPPGHPYVLPDNREQR